MDDDPVSKVAEPVRTFRRPQPHPPRRILLVDDDIFVRRYITNLLIHAGYEVDTVSDGAAAWQNLSTDSYDLLITDNNMPNVTGIELLKKVHAARMGLRVIMATGTLPKEELTRNPWLQPTATLLKPYTFADMLRTVNQVLRASHGAHPPLETDEAETPMPGPNDISQSEQIRASPNWPSRPAPDRLQL